MFKKTITFEDFGDPPQEHTQDFYFNLTKAEILEMQLRERGGYDELLKKIVAEEDPAKMIEHMKGIILEAYGKKEGVDFIKSDDIRARFAGSNAFSELFIELATNDESAAAFINGLFPQGLMQQIIDAYEEQGKGAPSEETVELPAGPPTLEEKDEPTDEELLKMNPKNMTQEQLIRAFQLKSAQGSPRVV